MIKVKLKLIKNLNYFFNKDFFYFYRVFNKKIYLKKIFYFKENIILNNLVFFIRTCLNKKNLIYSKFFKLFYLNFILNLYVLKSFYKLKLNIKGKNNFLKLTETYSSSQNFWWSFLDKVSYSPIFILEKQYVIFRFFCNYLNFIENLHNRCFNIYYKKNNKYIIKNKYNLDNFLNNLENKNFIINKNLLKNYFNKKINLKIILNNSKKNNRLFIVGFDYNQIKNYSTNFLKANKKNIYFEKGFISK